MIEDPRYDPRLMGKFGVNPEQDRHYRMLLIKELMKVHHDCREKTELDDMPMDELCGKFICIATKYLMRLLLRFYFD